MTALYEIVPAGGAWSGARWIRCATSAPGRSRTAARGGELLHLKLRYKEPEGRRSRQQQWTLVDRGQDLSATSADFRFAAAVAAFGMLLRDSPHKGAATFGNVLDLATSGLGGDRGGHRAELVELVKKARALTPGASRRARRPAVERQRAPPRRDLQQVAAQLVERRQVGGRRPLTHRVRMYLMLT